MSIRILVLATALAALAALAGGPPASAEAPVTTAATQNDVAAQIDAYLRSSPATRLEPDGPEGVVSSAQPDRKAHGVVSVSVGTGGYRSIYARSDMPVGKTGTLSVAVEDSRGPGRFGRYGGYGGYGGYDGRNLGVALSLGEGSQRKGGPDGVCRSSKLDRDRGPDAPPCRPDPRAW